MKRVCGMILAIFFLFPFLARPQNEGIKPVSNPAPPEKSTSYQRSTREMSVLNQQESGGNSTSPSGWPSGAANCYLEPGWAPGKVMLTGNSIMENLQLRYDIYHQQLQYIKGEDTLAFAKPDEIEGFIIGTHQFINTYYTIADQQGHGFFEVLVPGDCQLLMRRTIQYHGTPETNPDLKEEVYIRDNSYFISKKGDVATEVMLSKKSVLNCLKDKEVQLKQFIELNKMKLNSSDQLIKVVEYYNSLN